VITAAVAVGDAVADARAADVHKWPRRRAICLPRNMRRHKVASPVDMKISADSRALTTIGAEAPRGSCAFRAARPRGRDHFFRVNRWQNIAASLPLRPHLSSVERETHEEQNAVEGNYPACNRQSPAIGSQRQQRSSPVLRRVAPRWASG